MIKGVFIGLGVVVVLAVIPVVHFVGVPAGPFIAGYFGINSAREHSGSPGRKAFAYGLWLGTIVFAMLLIAAVLVTLLGNFAYPLLLWGGVVVVTFYYSTMSALGAWYSLLRAEERAARQAPAPSAS